MALFLTLQTYRVSHWLYENGRVAFAFALQGRMSEVRAANVVLLTVLMMSKEDW